MNNKASFRSIDRYVVGWVNSGQLRSIVHIKLVQYTIIAILTVMAYAPIFTGDFVYDDQTLIRDNPYITRLQTLSSYLSQEDGIVDPRDKGMFHTGYYRPLLNVTYFMDYKLWGMKAYGFRATNLILHLFTCFILYELLLQLTGYRSGSFWAVLFFAVHPIQTETVSIIVSRNNILATIFILASFYGYLAWWKKGTPVALAVSLLAFAGAVFSKEFGLMALPILFLYQRFLSEEKNFRKEIESYIPYLIIVAIYLVLRKTVVPTPFSIPDDIGMRIAYAPYLLAYNLKLILLPYNLHSFSVVYPNSFMAPMVMLSFLLVLCLALLLYALRKETLIVFCVAAFVVALLPVLNIINKASVSLIAMRWLYLPAAFFTCGFVWLLARIREKPGKRTRQIILMAVAAYFVATSCTLNAHLWHDQDTFLRQEVLHFDNDLYMGDYAEMMLKKKRYQEAEPFFQRSLRRQPKFARNFINYGALLIETGRPQDALDILERARPLSMGHQDRSDWNNNMGTALTLLGNYDEAHKHFDNALASDPQNALLNRNLAYLLFREGRTEEANQRLKISEQIKRTD